MNLFTFLGTEPNAILIIVGVLGLIVGSFLNVVIYRLPKMMEREWRTQCTQLLGDGAVIKKRQIKKTRFIKKLRLSPRRLRKLFATTNFLRSEQPAPTHSGDVFNLIWPRSRCPHCGHQITALENIPIFSYIWQRGKCTACHKPISIRYPLIEGLSAILAIITAVFVAPGWPLLGALALTWALLAASVIDFDHQLLPDSIILPMLWLGLLCNRFELYTDLESSLIGAIVGYLSLWTIYWLFKLITGKEGMGYGDFKLLALLGAWMGWQILPVIILMSSFVGAVVGITLIISRGHDRNVPIPFGPYLAAAGWLSLLWGDTLTHIYLG
ncbi:MAG: prepilin peptidase [Candidatus Parabeggiatoa sp. nov. 2]|nr:MAG: prepilin peptidase [Beggiatoa sp. 4572_84]RKZ62959.1 MAG: prepilin peptidase [Gammaproteobacteria bacterium]